MYAIFNSQIGNNPLPNIETFLFDNINNSLCNIINFTLENESEEFYSELHNWCSSGIINMQEYRILDNLPTINKLKEESDEHLFEILSAISKIDHIFSDCYKLEICQYLSKINPQN